MLSGLPGKAWDLIVDVHNGHLEHCGGFEIPAVSYSHKEVEAARGKFQVKVTSFADPTTKRSGKDQVEGVKRAASFPDTCFLCNSQRSNVASSPLSFLSLEGFFMATTSLDKCPLKPAKPLPLQCPSNRPVALSRKQGSHFIHSFV